MNARLSDGELAALEAAIEQALRTGDQTALDVLGYGEISTVVRWPTASGAVAAKRLPPFASRAAFEGYRDSVTTYLERLDRVGVRPLPTTVQGYERADGCWIGYCVQPIFAPEALVSRRLGACADDEALALLGRIVDRIEGAVSARLGLDGQASNWILDGDELGYLDVSTPLIRSERGEELLDTELFLASLPWALRGLVRWRFLGVILDKYYDVRGVLVDLLGNFYKEKLARLVAPFVEQLNATGRFRPALRVAEIHSYYRSDANLWALLQRLRRIDRFWQQRVRRRTYPFLLPGTIERHV